MGLLSKIQTGNGVTKKSGDDTPLHIFPKYLNNDEFEKRIFYVSVYESGILAQSWKDLLDVVWKEGTSIAQEVLNDPKKAVNDLQRKSNSSNASKNLLTTFALPLPNELNESTTHGWNTEKGIVASVVESVGTLNNINSMADKVLSRLSDKTNARKPLIDPGFFQNYTGTEPRAFTFNFDIIPSSHEEAKEILLMIAKLKKYSTPNATLGILQSPYYFQLEFSNDILTNMINIQDCIINNIDLNYSGSSFMDTTVDGVPKHMKLTIGFKERRMMLQEDWDWSISEIEDSQAKGYIG